MNSILNILFFISVYIAFLSPQILQAESFDEGELDNYTVSLNCDINASDRGRSRFDEIEELAIEFDTKLCQSMLSVSSENTISPDLFIDYGKKAESLLLNQFNDDSVRTAIITQFKHYTSSILNSAGSVSYNDYPILGTTSSAIGLESSESMLYFSIPGTEKGSIISNDFAESCTTVTGDESDPEPFTSCSQALENAAYAFNNYLVSIRNYRIAQNEPRFNYLNGAWNRYMREARSQTILDVWWTSVIHDDYYSQHKLVPPHPVQFFLLRPQVVYEFSRDANKGNRTQLGLGVEWFGVNWWDAEIPFGVGVISVYSDYENVYSIGHGVQLTFNNSTSIGWVDRRGSNSFFVTLDFFKLWGEGSTTLDQYKNDPWSWVNF